jgi:hypothetical protein
MKSSEMCAYGFTQAKRKFDSEETPYVLLILLNIIPSISYVSNIRRSIVMQDSDRALPTPNKDVTWKWNKNALLVK